MNVLKMNALTVALATVAGTASPLYATEVAVDAQTCAAYRQGPLVAQRLAIYRQPEIYDWLEIRHRYEYLAQPHLPHDAFGLAPGTPPDSGLFEIEIETGQPRPPVEQRYNQSPFDYTHFTMLIDGMAYLRDLGRLIGIYARAPSHLTPPGRWENGAWVEEPVPFQQTGELFHGYDRISVPNAAAKDTDLFIQEADGEITGFLRCKRLGSVPNPGCTLHERSAHFRVQFDFRRNQMHLIEKIRRHARAFTACLTWQNEGE